MKKENKLSLWFLSFWYIVLIFALSQYIVYLGDDRVPYQFDSIQTLPGIFMGGGVMGMIFSVLRNPNPSFAYMSKWMFFGTLLNFAMLWPFSSETTKWIEQSMFFIYISLFFFLAYKIFKTGRHTTGSTIVLMTAWFYNMMAFPLHLVMMFPMLDKMEENRYKEVIQVVETRDSNSIWCKDPSLHCFVYEGPDSLPIEVDADGMAPIQSFAEMEPGIGKRNIWHISKGVLYNYRVYGAFFDDVLKLNLVISSETHHNDWRDLGNDFVYYFHPVIVGAFQFFLMLCWLFYEERLKPRIKWFKRDEDGNEVFVNDISEAASTESFKGNKIAVTVILFMFVLFAWFMYMSHMH